MYEREIRHKTAGADDLNQYFSSVGKNEASDSPSTVFYRWLESSLSLELEGVSKSGCPSRQALRSLLSIRVAWSEDPWLPTTTLPVVLGEGFPHTAAFFD